MTSSFENRRSARLEPAVAEIDNAIEAEDGDDLGP